MLTDFIKKYKLILFDLDGVITSESAYFTAAALTVYEALFKQMPADMSKDEITDLVFCGGKTVTRLKTLGINTNWDLAYLVYLYAKITNKASIFEAVYSYYSSIDERVPGLYDIAAKMYCEKTGESYEYSKRQGKLWNGLRDMFQRWYLGDGGKDGLIKNEKPVIPLQKLKAVLNELKENNIKIGAGTGRPHSEAQGALDNFGVFDLFSEKHFITYTDIEAAQKNVGDVFGEVDFSKPHPYIFLKGALSKDFSDMRIYQNNFDKYFLENVLAVGDSISDALCAKAAGIDFCAVLTGVTGSAAKTQFEEIGVSYIIDSIGDFIT